MESGNETQTLIRAVFQILHNGDDPAWVFYAYMRPERQRDTDEDSGADKAQQAAVEVLSSSLREIFLDAVDLVDNTHVTNNLP